MKHLKNLRCDSPDHLQKTYKIPLTFIYFSISIFYGITSFRTNCLYFKAQKTFPGRFLSNNTFYLYRTAACKSNPWNVKPQLNFVRKIKHHTVIKNLFYHELLYVFVFLRNKSLRSCLTGCLVLFVLKNTGFHQMFL